MLYYHIYYLKILPNFLDLFYFNLCKIAKHWDSFLTHCRVEILPILDTIRFGVVEKHILEYVDNDAVFTKPNNLLLVL